MDTILLSFLCGAAFIGGGVATTLMVVWGMTVWNTPNKKNNEQLMDYWHKSNENHVQQVKILERIAATIEKGKNCGCS
jgi:hypothetical protein